MNASNNLASAAVGLDAKWIAQLFFNFRCEGPLSISFEKPRNDALTQLDAVYLKCKEADWDGYLAKPASVLSWQMSQKVISSLPADVPMPEIAVDPDGEFSLEWHGGNRRVFSVSVGANNALTYAGIFGASRVRGVETFHGELNRLMLDYVRRATA